MSVSIATGGMFNNCCGGGPGVGGGGAPPVHQYAEQYDSFNVKVVKVYFDDLDGKKSELPEVRVKEIHFD
jgi:cell division GTPase FtsZ